MRTVLKYPVQPGPNILRLPDTSIVRTVQAQGNSLCLWAEVDTDQPLVDCHIGLYGTGWPLPDPVGPYLCTVQNGGYVWHVYGRWLSMSPVQEVPTTLT